MRVHTPTGAAHLTYCTNIHPAQGWDDVLANLRRYAVAVKARLSPDSPFGLGLRLSDAESRQLSEPGELDRFREFLNEENLYVFTFNGFPFGAFHGQRVKEQVFSPDWRDPARAVYTNRLAEILASLAPENLEPGVSTSPLSYRRWFADNDPPWETFIANLVRVCERLTRLERETGRALHLDIEPEPDGLIETTGEFVAFVRGHLLPAGGGELAKRLGVSREAAEREILRRVRLCLDTCHAAVLGEDVERTLDDLESLGASVGKVQVSCALIADAEAQRDALAPFADDTYLHQVVDRGIDSATRRFADLPEALSAPSGEPGAQWRVHFHVPVFAERLGPFRSTQNETRRIIRLARDRNLTDQYEVETYTWGVLPEKLKRPLNESIERELAWTKDELASESEGG